MEICQGAFSFPFHEEGFRPQVIHRSLLWLRLQEQRMDCRKVKTRLFINTIDCDQCLNEDMPSMTVFVLACPDRGIIDGRHNCVLTLFWLVTVLGLLVSFEISHSLWRSYIHTQAGLAYSVQQLGCRLEIWGLGSQFLVGTGDFFFLSFWKHPD